MQTAAPPIWSEGCVSVTAVAKNVRPKNGSFQYTPVFSASSGYGEENLVRPPPLLEPAQRLADLDLGLDCVEVAVDGAGEDRVP